MDGQDRSGRGSKPRESEAVADAAFEAVGDPEFFRVQAGLFALGRLPEAFQALDAKGRLRLVNPAWEALFGVSDAAARGRSFEDFLEPGAVSAFRAILSDLAAGREPPRELILNARRADDGRGSRLILSWEAVREASGRVAGLHCLLRPQPPGDPPEAFPPLALLEALPVLIQARDASGRAVFWNRECERVTGYAAREIMEAPRPEALIGPAAGEAWTDEPGKGRGGRREVCWRSRDGGLRTVAETDMTGRPPMPGWASWSVGVDVTSRVKAEKALFDQVGFVHSLLEAAGVPIFYKDLSGTYLGCNQAFEEFLGRSRQAIIGAEVRDVAPPELSALYEAKDRELLENGDRQVYLAKARRADGDLRDILFHKALFRDASGRSVGIIGVMTDVTESARLEAALRQSEEQYRLLVDNAAQGVLVLQDGLIRFVNPRMVELGGYAAEALLDRPFLDFVDPEDREMVALRHKARMGGGSSPEVYSCRIVHASGEVRWAEISGVVCQWRGRPAGLIFVIDVTSRKLAEARLENERKRLLSVFDNIPGPAFVIRPDGVVVESNVAFRERFGDPTGRLCVEILGRGLDACATCRSLPGPDEFCARRMFEAASTDGVTWQIYDAPFLDADGSPLLLKLMLDISERKRFEDQLNRAKTAAEAANKAKSEFLATMSHEIRTPLNGVLGMLQLLAASGLDTRRMEFCETALSSGRSLLTIINDILQISQIEAGVSILRETAFAPQAFLSDVLTLFRPQAAEKGLALRADPWPDPSSVLLCDENRLRQILFNLVGNALKFTEAGEVSVSFGLLPIERAPGRRLLYFCVRDTGVGFPDDRIDEAFQAFTQVDGSYSRRRQGTGLGLGVVSRLVRLMGGTIAVESERGAGAAIHFTVEVGLPGLDQAEPKTLPPTIDAPAGLKILLAEDERINQITAMRFLEKLGHMVVCAQDGRQALEFLRSENFDCVLMDIQMPVVNGLEAARRIRSEPSLAAKASIPIIALTAHAMAGDREKFLEAGMDAYLAKPVDLEELRRALARAMARRSTCAPASR